VCLTEAGVTHSLTCDDYVETNRSGTMRMRIWVSLGTIFVMAVGLALVAGRAIQAAEGAKAPAPPAAAKGGTGLVPLEIALPKALFTTTPKDIKPAKTLEPYSDKPRPAFPVPPGVTNLALNKKVTSSDPTASADIDLVTDGDKEGSDGSYVTLGPGKQWAQIDLGAAADIYAIIVWHYHGEARVYHAVVVQVSDDPGFTKGVKTVFNNDFDNSAGLGIGKDLEYIDDYRGKLINAKNAKGEPTRGRYVRLWSKGNTSDDLNHYVEVEVHGKMAK
jgi:hypothetical protein